MAGKYAHFTRDKVFIVQLVISNPSHLVTNQINTYIHWLSAQHLIKIVTQIKRVSVAIECSASGVQTEPREVRCVANVAGNIGSMLQINACYSTFSCPLTTIPLRN